MFLENGPFHLPQSCLTSSLTLPCSYLEIKFHLHPHTAFIEPQEVSRSFSGCSATFSQTSYLKYHPPTLNFQRARVHQHHKAVSMSEKSPLKVVEKLLSNTTNAVVVEELVTPDATYISLNYHHPNLTSIMPWCGTHEKAGPKAILETFIDVGKHWETKDFTTKGFFGSGEDVAVFGSFTYKSRVMGIERTSPFSIWCKVNADGKVTYMQFMEDTLMTSSTFQKSGSRTYAAHPDGHEVTF